MGVAISDDHRELAKVVRSFLADHDARKVARGLLDADAENLPPYWANLAALGWLGLHLPEDLGGQGYGLPELAVVVSEFGWAVAPGPFLPTVLAAGVLAGSEHADLVPALAAGSRIGALGLGGALERSGDTVSGDAGPVLGAGIADVLVLPVGADLAVVEAAAVTVTPGGGLDPTRRVATVRADAAPARFLPGGRATAVRLARALAAAEAAGLAAACTEMAVAYAKQREQFGRTIGTFQAIKHHLANMFVESELAAAVAWDAARVDPRSPEADLAAAVAMSRAVRAAVRCSEQNIQVHGGIGFTWEHDAHLFLRRANALAGVLAATGDPETEISDLVAGGVRRSFAIGLPPEAEDHRPAAREVAERVRSLSADERRIVLRDTGYLVPHWPKPWGRGADAVEQLVIEEEFADIEIPSLGITGWNILTIIQLGTPEQQQRWVPDALAGVTTWCQLFSEPGAGSDAAAIRTRGERTDGGWIVTGQKVWTSRAHECQWGFATVRTDASGTKHQGVTMMAIDLAAPGVEVRPLREIAGDALFNEVFLDAVFVPDTDVVGEVGAGWSVARAVLGNEKISIGAEAPGVGLEAHHLLKPADRYQPGDTGYRREIGRLLAEKQSLRLLNLRAAARAVQGSGPGPEGNVTKLLTGEHVQRVAELALRILGPAAVSGGREQITTAYLYSRAYTIAGGTAEVLRNQIAERILGLPRDPLIT